MERGDFELYTRLMVKGRETGSEGWGTSSPSTERCGKVDRAAALPQPSKVEFSLHFQKHAMRVCVCVGGGGVRACVRVCACVCV